ncbi:unnamed protein product [Adineta ricciae]|uniref:Uncharacterized protein n=1 Tax=Adineta ricciae TaxID=249248 RepID=A0A813XS32_ADIRI|nr:unnamed protein product [Adineta ricciae]CAF1324475.1 unnamed protein product [Adineta ricciae]
MGGILHRSAARRDDEKIKKKDRRKRQREENPDLDIGFNQNNFPITNIDENQDPNLEFVKSYDLWNSDYDNKFTMNINDPPGAPRSYSPSQNEMMFQQWSPSVDMNNPFYPGSMFPSVPPFNIAYDPNHQLQPQISTTLGDNSPKVKAGERSPKRVHFAPTPSSQLAEPIPMKPLTNTQSWHEPRSMTSAPSRGAPQIKPERLSNRSSVPRSSTNSHKPAPAQTPVQKPIYVGIDHQATLIERSKRLVNKRQRPNLDENSPEKLTVPNNHQPSRSHPHKHRKPTDSPRSDHETMLNKYFETLQPKVSLIQRQTAQSTSVNKFAPNIDQITSRPNDIKLTKSRSVRRQQSAINTEIKPVKSQENHRQRPPSGSPLVTHSDSSKRRIEHSHSSTAVMRVSLSKNGQQPSFTRVRM